MCKLSVIFAFCLLPFAFAGEAGAAAQIKKAAPVAAKASGGTEGAASLVPSVLGLVTGVMQMNSQMKALTGECLPSAAERTFVDNTMKEWAKAGQTTAKSMQSALKRTGCSETGSSYEADAQIIAPGLL
ncbi:MAG: hypothetical protein LBJ18_04670, partial [Rickettsiales bacterium]|nr:hypothetical protein [Rickettsiales bacterium]